MGKIYVNQTALKITFLLNNDISGYSAVNINVSQPDFSTATWTATVEDAETGEVYFDNFTTTTLSINGDYYLQPEVEFTNGNKILGETYILTVYKKFQ